MMARTKIIPWTPPPIHPLFRNEVERAAAQYRIDRRTEGKPACACGANSTVCDVGPPTVWRCQPCADAAWEEEKAAVAAQQERRAHERRTAIGR